MRVCSLLPEHAARPRVVEETHGAALVDVPEQATVDYDRPSVRDLSSVSPSARALLLVKAQTDLPFARAAAERLFGAEAVEQAAREAAAEPGAGVLEVRTLDALDDRAFRDSVAAFPPGPLAVVHEGLLMYLDAAEKALLAASVRAALEARGGAWITADVYVRSATSTYRDARTQRFLADHRVEEQKFADLADAERFFATQGFAVRERLVPPADPWPVRHTWILELAP
jgi:hypothetical protein